MSQLSLFPEQGIEETKTEAIPPIAYYPDFLNKEEADELFEYSKNLDWKQNQIKMRGNIIELPRLEYITGDEGCSYFYSKSVLLEPVPWCEVLSTVRSKVEELTGFPYQIVIGNYYRGASDSIGWHDDLNKSMPEMPAISNLTLGHERKFQIRTKQKGSQIHDYWLPHGSLLLMKPGFQENYIHQLPKSTKNAGVRISWTFRPHLGRLK